MKSKEEILDSHHKENTKHIRSISPEQFPVAYRKTALDSMEEYAAQFKDSRLPRACECRNIEQAENCTKNCGRDEEPEPYQGSAGVWVKASERLPEIRKAVPVKIDGDYGVGNFADNRNGDIRFWHNGKNEWFMPQSFPYIFWLDSAASPAGDGEAIEILKELCWLKSHKDNVGKDSVYRQRQPEAWKRANDFLNRLTLTTK